MFDFDDLEDKAPLQDSPMMRKPRVLCLHGMAGNAHIMRTQMKHFVDAAEDRLELIFIDAGLKVADDNAEKVLISQYFPGQEHFEYAKPTTDANGWRTYDGIDGALEHIQAALRKEAPIDAVLGFSQGSNFATMIAAQAHKKVGSAVKCTVHLCGTKPGWKTQKPELFDEPIPLPALIVHAEKDTVGLGADEVARLFEAPERLTHSGNHRPLPPAPTEAKQLAASIVDFLSKHASA
eukprot:TRINITY_DN29216_c0_g1_i1.p1 TRINITY_DN29216_c0_g1~~TRINITY_DN29216_c0_g1_i1.p1  ORF type:complete len:252 (+),score=52.04 TRINITY_DN29216_c0_g1_i1:49-756(+)